MLKEWKRGLSCTHSYFRKLREGCKEYPTPFLSVTLHLPAACNPSNGVNTCLSSVGKDETLNNKNSGSGNIVI